MSGAITSKENLALNLIYHWRGVMPKQVRSFDEWEEIARNIPKLEALHAYINEKLKLLADRGIAPYQICYFKAGDRYPWYRELPDLVVEDHHPQCAYQNRPWEMMHGRNPLRQLD